MRQYYKSDKKKREDLKRKQREEKQLKRLNKNSNKISTSDAPTIQPDASTPDLKPS
jgi:hypothetical protein